MDHPRLNDLLNCPCPSCGSQLQFSAEKQGMACGHCGYTEALAFTKNNLREIALSEGRADDATRGMKTVEQRIFDCRSCGARTNVFYDQPTIVCGFCGSTNVNPEATRTRLIEPAGVLPFRLSKRQAQEKFTAWIGRDIFAPNDLKALSRLDALKGVYIPFWTFDAETTSHWEGEAGTYYTVPVQVRDANGRTMTQQQQRVRWTYRQGTYEHFFDDVLIQASGKLSQPQLREVFPYRLEEVVDYEPRVLLGWEAEVYGVDVEEGQQRARQEIKQRIEAACAQACAADTYRNLRVETEYENPTFKHLLLPLWICSYQYNGKAYQFLINGQTGSIAGTRPKSFWKIALLVVAFILLVVILIGLAKR
jgi:DNA-directed RNA polymerase subunit M/transcription elongation factor TFIIS